MLRFLVVHLVFYVQNIVNLPVPQSHGDKGICLYYIFYLDVIYFVISSVQPDLFNFLKN